MKTKTKIIIVTKLAKNDAHINSKQLIENKKFRVISDTWLEFIDKKDAEAWNETNYINQTSFGNKICLLPRYQYKTISNS